jgi:hypothetical protein
MLILQPRQQAPAPMARPGPGPRDGYGGYGNPYDSQPPPQQQHPHHQQPPHYGSSSYGGSASSSAYGAKPGSHYGPGPSSYGDASGGRYY